MRDLWNIYVQVQTYLDYWSGMNSFLAGFFTTCSRFFRVPPIWLSFCFPADPVAETNLHTCNIISTNYDHHSSLRITLVWWTLLHTQAHAHTYAPLDHELIVILHSVLSELVPSLSLGMAQRDLSQKRISSAHGTCTFFNAKARNKGTEIFEIHSTSVIRDANADSFNQGI